MPEGLVGPTDDPEPAKPPESEPDVRNDPVPEPAGPEPSAEPASPEEPATITITEPTLIVPEDQ